MQYLNTAQTAIASKSTLEILTGVKLHLSEDALTITGSNSDISIETILSIADEDACLAASCFPQDSSAKSSRDFRKTHSQ